MINNLQWRDGIEILFFAAVIYNFLIWLKKDKEKNLIFPFISYCLLFFVSYYVYLPTISNILFLSCPIVILILIVLHQENIQKKFIMYRNIKTNISNSTNWPDELIKVSLNALNKNKEIIFVIEKADSLDKLINAPFKFQADLQKDILDILLDKHICNPNYFIWLNKDGKLIAINSTWKLNHDQDWLSEELKQAQKWKQDCIFISTKTDAIIFKINPLSRSFDIFIQGKLAESLSPQDTLLVLKRNLNLITDISSNVNIKQANKQVEKSL